MSHWEAGGKTDEWYTPKYVFDALGTVFDLDTAAPADGPRHVPCNSYYSDGSLDKEWNGFVWMNPPFGGRNGLVPWLNKFFSHANGVALVPDRTSAPWWQKAARRADGVMFIDGKVKFEKPDGTTGDSPSTGTCLMASGSRAFEALINAHKNGLGILMRQSALTK
jgi:phage N-6-adenine-methyltransferase